MTRFIMLVLAIGAVFTVAVRAPDARAASAAVIDADARGIRNWLSPPLSNARLVSMNLYEGQVAAFRAIYDECDRSLACFYARAEQLGSLSYQERDLAMQVAPESNTVASPPPDGVSNRR